jgi:hypothetical protein
MYFHNQQAGEDAPPKVIRKTENGGAAYDFQNNNGYDITAWQ